MELKILMREDDDMAVNSDKSITSLMSRVKLNAVCLLLSYRNQRSCNEKHPSDFDALHYNTGA